MPGTVVTTTGWKAVELSDMPSNHRMSQQQNQQPSIKSILQADGGNC